MTSTARLNYNYIVHLGFYFFPQRHLSLYIIKRVLVASQLDASRKGGNFYKFFFLYFIVVLQVFQLLYILLSSFPVYTRATIKTSKPLLLCEMLSTVYSALTNGSSIQLNFAVESRIIKGLFQLRIAMVRVISSMRLFSKV